MRNKISFRLKLEKFITEQLWQHAFVIAIVCLFAYLFNKPFEAILFSIAHTVMRPQFDKQYHCGKTALCLMTSCGVAYLGISKTLPMSISLLSAIPVSFVICWVGYLVQYKIDLTNENKTLGKELDILAMKLKELGNLDLYKMTEKELREYGASKQLSEIQQDILVMRVIEHLKISEICNYRNYGRTTIKYHIAEIKKKLKVEKI